MAVPPLAARDDLDHLPPLVTQDEIDQLTDKLGQVARGEAFFLEINDYLHDIGSYGAKEVWDSLRVLLQINAVFMFRAAMPTVKVTGLTNDIIEGLAHASSPAAAKAFDAYGQLASIANLTRAFSQGGQSAMRNITRWVLKNQFDDEARRQFDALGKEIRRSLDFARACGISGVRSSPFEKAEIFIARNVSQLDLDMVRARPEGQRFAPLGHLSWAGRYRPDPSLVKAFGASGLASPLTISWAPGMAVDSLTDMIRSLGRKYALVCLELPENATPSLATESVAALAPELEGVAFVCRVKVDVGDDREAEVERLKAVYGAFFAASRQQLGRLGGLSVDTATFTVNDLPHDRLTPGEAMRLAFALGDGLLE